MRWLIILLSSGTAWATQAEVPAEAPAEVPAEVAAPETAEAAPPATEAAAPEADASATATAAVQTEGEGKLWNARVDVHLRMPAIDEDPENDVALFYLAKVSGKLFEGAKAFIQAGLFEYFTAEEGDTAFRLQDTQIGFSYATPVKLAEGHELGVTHIFKLYLPTSRASQKQDLYLAPLVRLALDYEVVEGFSVALYPHFRYRVHQYAERAGPYGAPNLTQLDTGLHAGADYTLSLGDFGKAGAGFSLGSIWLQRYAARDDFESPQSDQAPWLQTYDWEAHLTYTPIRYVSVAFSIEHNQPVLRDGVVNVDFFDATGVTKLTEFVFAVSGRY